MRPPLVWFDFEDHAGTRWKVALSCEHDSPALEECHGLAYFESSAVLIDVDQSRDEQDAIVLHELLHVAYGGAKDNPGEEAFVKRAAPRLLKILRQFGFKLPRRPRGVGELERRVRDDDEGEE
jgi:hypothetical protein